METSLAEAPASSSRSRRRLRAHQVATAPVGRPPRRLPPGLVRFTAVLARVPSYIRLAYRLASDNRLTPAQRALAASGALYTVSPIDAVPGFIPVLGQLDDLAVLLLSLRQTLRTCQSEIAAEHLARTGITLAVIDADLITVRDTAVWIGRTTGKTLRAAALHLARLGQSQGKSALRSLATRLRRAGPRSKAAPRDPSGNQPQA